MPLQLARSSFLKYIMELWLKAPKFLCWNCFQSKALQRAFHFPEQPAMAANIIRNTAFWQVGQLTSKEGNTAADGTFLQLITWEMCLFRTFFALFPTPLRELEGNILLYIGSPFCFYIRPVKSKASTFLFYYISKEDPLRVSGGPWGGWTDLLT